jgi:hypothetical protein
MKRREFLGAAAVTAVAVPFAASAQPAAPAKGARIVLLGTKGGPPPEGGRSQPATLF